jgi:alpha-amylase/alpha-mannosidase (GH57 family)
MLLSLQLLDTFSYVQDDEQLRVLNNQIEEDRKIIISRHNLVEVHKVLEELFELTHLL